jgi:hypothetical protein
MKQKLFGLAFVSITAIVLAACSGKPATQIGDKDSDFMIALPRIEVNIDNDGNPSFAGISPKLIEFATGGQVKLEQFRMDKSWVDYLVSTNTQHIELLHKDDGVYMWMNNKRLPNLAFTKDSIGNIGEVLDKAGNFEAYGMNRQQLDVVRRFLPFINRIGLNVLIKFPMKGGEKEIAARDVTQPIAPAPTAKKEDASTMVRVVVNYDQTGEPSIAGLSAADVENVFGIQLYNLRLQPEFVAQMSKQNVQHISIRSHGEGLALSVNDMALPDLQCDAECLSNTADTLATLNTYPDLQQYNEPIKAFAPYIRNVNAEFALKFPLAPGSQAIPVPFN